LSGFIKSVGARCRQSISPCRRRREIGLEGYLQVPILKIAVMAAAVYFTMGTAQAFFINPPVVYGQP